MPYTSRGKVLFSDTPRWKPRIHPDTLRRIPSVLTDTRHRRSLNDSGSREDGMIVDGLTVIGALGRRGVMGGGVALLSCWVLGHGCAASRPDTAVLELVPSPNPYVEDIPIPVGFRMVDSSSEDWVSADIRYLRHRYTGKADKVSARVFYREQMPLVRWTPISDAQIHGRYTMRFERERETCTIEIHNGRRVGRHKILVDVLITPGADAAPARMRDGLDYESGKATRTSRK